VAQILDDSVEGVKTIDKNTVVSQVQVAIAVNEDFQADVQHQTMSAEEVVILLRLCTRWSEVIAITSKLNKKTRLRSWAALDESEHQRIIAMKEQAIDTSNVGNQGNDQHTEPATSIKVGDKVMWFNHYPHLNSWLPLEVQRIDEDGQVKLEMCNLLLPIQELSLP
jgi:hypothetical protein